MAKKSKVEHVKAAIEATPSLPVQLPPAAENILKDKLVDIAAKTVVQGKIATYFKLTSITWWAGAGMVAVGALKGFGLADPRVDFVGEVLSIATGGVTGTSPALLVGAGLGLIGIRARLSRML